MTYYGGTNIYLSSWKYLISLPNIGLIQAVGWWLSICIMKCWTTFKNFVKATNYIMISCDKMTFINNQTYAFVNAYVV
jgi:hypothetical protein